MTTTTLTITLCLLGSVLQQSPAQWVFMEGPPGGDVASVAVKGENLFAGTSFTGINVPGMYRTTLDNMNWSLVGMDSIEVLQIEVVGSTVFAGTRCHGVYRSTDDGTSWMMFNNGLTNLGISAFASNDQFLFVGTGSCGVNAAGVFRAAGADTHWTQVNSGLTNLHVSDLLVVGEYLFAGASSSYGGGLFRSTNSGESWEMTPFVGGTSGLVSIDTIIFAARGVVGIFRSTDYGQTWVEPDPALFGNVVSLVPSDTNLFAGNADAGGVLRSSDLGATWVSVNEDLPSMYAYPRFANDTLLFADVYASGLWRRHLSDFVTNVPPPEEESGHGDGSLLGPLNLQNYPNPFNSISNFEFRISNLGEVTLKVYDLLGREVATIVDEKLAPGTYTRQWDAAGLASGVYVYRLSTGDFVQTRKLVLIR